MRRRLQGEAFSCLRRSLQRRRGADARIVVYLRREGAGWIDYAVGLIALNPKLEARVESTVNAIVVPVLIKTGGLALGVEPRTVRCRCIARVSSLRGGRGSEAEHNGPCGYCDRCYASAVRHLHQSVVDTPACRHPPKCFVVEGTRVSPPPRHRENANARILSHRHHDKSRYRRSPFAFPMTPPLCPLSGS